MPILVLQPITHAILVLGLRGLATLSTFSCLCQCGGGNKRQKMTLCGYDRKTLKGNIRRHRRMLSMPVRKLNVELAGPIALCFANDMVLQGLVENSATTTRNHSSQVLGQILEDSKRPSSDRDPQTKSEIFLWNLVDGLRLYMEIFKLYNHDYCLKTMNMRYSVNGLVLKREMVAQYA
ncbi:hypothetical protein EV359DRAFT_59482 [Lentinula novae-zelandiae]|nr:hypothetical protein EV359DRAFT_59482 [Lentinula novae-zelandiae]